jgi:hypothetical protein
MSQRKQEQQRRREESRQAERKQPTREERQNIKPQADARDDLGNARKSRASGKDREQR